MIWFEKGTETTQLTHKEIEAAIYSAASQLGNRQKVLAVPPDYTRIHSQAGMITAMVYRYYQAALTDILPALGTHTPMTEHQISDMFSGVPQSLFRVHDWRNDVKTVGTVPASFISEITAGALHFNWPAQLNRLVCDGGHDLILSIGQVVPHEVAGMANQSKNLFVGTGGAEGINKSHFVGAVVGLERIMGRMDNPVRQLLGYAANHFIRSLPVVYILTVVGLDGRGCPVTRGLFIGDDDRVFEKAAALSLKVNFTLLPQPLKKMVVYLPEGEYKSTWLGNKSIYRTRMALDDGAELIVLAPGVREFGEDREIDRLIRKYGYRGTNTILEAVESNADLQANLGAAAHLIHGSPEGRFQVTYCTDLLEADAVKSAGFSHSPLADMMRHYNPSQLTDGWNVFPGGEEIYYISNPALGLWSSESKFSNPLT